MRLQAGVAGGDSTECNGCGGSRPHRTGRPRPSSRDRRSSARVGTLHRTDDVAAGPVPLRVAGEALDPVLRGVGEEVAPLVHRGELYGVADVSAGDGHLTTGGAGRRRERADRPGCRRCRFAVRPSVVPPRRSEVHLLVGGVVVVALHVRDLEPAGLSAPGDHVQWGERGRTYRLLVSRELGNFITIPTRSARVGVRLLGR